MTFTTGEDCCMTGLTAWLVAADAVASDGVDGACCDWDSDISVACVAVVARLASEKVDPSSGVELSSVLVLLSAHCSCGRCVCL